MQGTSPDGCCHRLLCVCRPAPSTASNCSSRMCTRVRCLPQRRAESTVAHRQSLRHRAAFCLCMFWIHCSGLVSHTVRAAAVPANSCGCPGLVAWFLDFQAQHFDTTVGFYLYCVSFQAPPGRCLPPLLCRDGQHGCGGAVCGARGADSHHLPHRWAGAPVLLLCVWRRAPAALPSTILRRPAHGLSRRRWAGMALRCRPVAHFLSACLHASHSVRACSPGAASHAAQGGVGEAVGAQARRHTPRFCFEKRRRPSAARLALAFGSKCKCTCCRCHQSCCMR